MALHYAQAAHVLAIAVGTDERIVEETLREETAELLSVISETKATLSAEGGAERGAEGDTAVNAARDVRVASTPSGLGNDSDEAEVRERLRERQVETT